MIEYFTIADVDYGRRVREGVEQATAMMKEKHHTALASADEACDAAKKMGKEADPIEFWKQQNLIIKPWNRKANKATVRLFLLHVRCFGKKRFMALRGRKSGKNRNDKM
jgi:hypothetical protein